MEIKALCVGDILKLNCYVMDSSGPVRKEPEELFAIRRFSRTSRSIHGDEECTGGPRS